MALVNYSLPFGAPVASWATISPIQPHAVNNLYEPAPHHQENVLQNDDYYKNGPYRHQQQPASQQNPRNYLPPQQQAQKNTNRNAYIPPTRARTYGESTYSQQPSTSFNNQQNTGYVYGQRESPYQAQQTQPQPQTTKAPNPRPTAPLTTSSAGFTRNQAAGYPEQPPGFKPIQAGQGSRTQNGKLESLYT